MKKKDQQFYLVDLKILPEAIKKTIRVKEMLQDVYKRQYYLSEGIDAVEKEILNEFSFPVVLKPACEGSTIGIEIVREKENLSLIHI